MDANIAVGTRSDAQAVAFMQRRAIPKRLHHARPSDLVKFPTSTVQQVIQRQKAEIAAQRGFQFPPSVNGVDPDIIAKAQGLEGSKRKAASRVDFDAFAHHRANGVSAVGPLLRGPICRNVERARALRSLSLPPDGPRLGRATPVYAGIYESCIRR